jgi:predicted amidohydrolase
MIVRADVAGRTADRVSFGSSAIVDARGTVLRAAEALSEDNLAAEVTAVIPTERALPREAIDWDHLSTDW